jgi:hypothetical protein
MRARQQANDGANRNSVQTKSARRIDWHSNPQWHPTSHSFLATMSSGTAAPPAVSSSSSSPPTAPPPAPPVRTSAAIVSASSAANNLTPRSRQLKEDRIFDYFLQVELKPDDGASRRVRAVDIFLIFVSFLFSLASPCKLAPAIVEAYPNSRVGVFFTFFFFFFFFFSFPNTLFFSFSSIVASRVLATCDSILLS